MSLTKTQSQGFDQGLAAAESRALIPLNSTIYTTAEYASAKASTAHVRLFIIVRREDGPPYIIRNITHLVADASGSRISSRGGLTYGGWGYGKEFQAVYSLGHALYPDGYTCTGTDCRSNDHSNGHPNDGLMHHSDGGYAFQQISL